MSKFLEKHPKLAIAFAGGAKYVASPLSLISTGIGVAGMRGLVVATGLSTGGAVIVPAAISAGLCLATNGIRGAREALRMNAFIAAARAGTTPRGYKEVEMAVEKEGDSSYGVTTFEKKGWFNKTKKFVVKHEL